MCIVCSRSGGRKIQNADLSRLNFDSFATCFCERLCGRLFAEGYLRKALRKVLRRSYCFCERCCGRFCAKDFANGFAEGFVAGFAKSFAKAQQARRSASPTGIPCFSPGQYYEGQTRAWVRRGVELGHLHCFQFLFEAPVVADVLLFNLSAQAFFAFSPLFRDLCRINRPSLWQVWTRSAVSTMTTCRFLALLQRRRHVNRQILVAAKPTQ